MQKRFVQHLPIACFLQFWKVIFFRKSYMILKSDIFPQKLHDSEKWYFSAKATWFWKVIFFRKSYMILKSDIFPQKLHESEKWYFSAKATWFWKVIFFRKSYMILKSDIFPQKLHDSKKPLNRTLQPTYLRAVQRLIYLNIVSSHCRSQWFPHFLAVTRFNSFLHAAHKR